MKGPGTLLCPDRRHSLCRTGANPGRGSASPPRRSPPVCPEKDGAGEPTPTTQDPEPCPKTHAHPRPRDPPASSAGIPSTQQRARQGLGTQQGDQNEGLVPKALCPQGSARRPPRPDTARPTAAPSQPAGPTDNGAARELWAAVRRGHNQGNGLGVSKGKGTGPARRAGGARSCRAGAETRLSRVSSRVGPQLTQETQAGGGGGPRGCSLLGPAPLCTRVAVQCHRGPCAWNGGPWSQYG